MANLYLKGLIDSAPKQPQQRTQQHRLYSAPASNTRKIKRQQQAKLEQERKHLKSAATPASTKLAKQRETYMFPNSTELGSVRHRECQAKHTNAKRRAASASAKSRFLKSRGHSIGWSLGLGDSNFITMATPEPFSIPGERPNSQSDRVNAVKRFDSGLHIDHTTTLLQLKHYNQETEPEAATEVACHSNHLEATQNEESHDLFQAYAHTVAHESKLRNVRLQKDTTMRTDLLDALRAKLATHLEKTNALLLKVVQATSDLPQNATQRPEKELSGTYLNIQTKIAQAKAEAEADQLPPVENPLSVALQRIAAAQQENNQLLQIQREWNNRLELVLTYATPREEKVVQDRKRRGIEIDRLKEKNAMQLDQQRGDREEIMFVKKQIKEMKRLLQVQQDEINKVRLIQELASQGHQGMSQGSPGPMGEEYTPAEELEDEDDEDDEEDKAWKKEQQLIILPQEYVDAQFVQRVRDCAKSFAAITAEAKRASTCDVCKRTLVAPRITRGCSHCFCFKCLHNSDENAFSEDDEADGEDGERKEKRPPTENNKSKDKNRKANKRAGPVGVDVVCPVCKMNTEARVDDVMVQVLQKMSVFKLSGKK